MKPNTGALFQVDFLRVQLQFHLESVESDYLSLAFDRAITFCSNFDNPGSPRGSAAIFFPEVPACLSSGFPVFHMSFFSHWMGQLNPQRSKGRAIMENIENA